MKPDEAAKLLGGYATGTLTEAERQALFDAALHDQDLFNALADEQALKELLDDPAARRRLLLVLEEPKQSLLAGIAAWLRRPMAWAAAGGLAAALLVTLFIRTGAPPAIEQVAMKTERQAPAPPPVARRDEPAASIQPEAVKAKLPEVLSEQVESKPAELAERKEAAAPAPEFEARPQAAGQVALNEPPPAAPPPPPPATELPAQVALSKAPPAPPPQADVAKPLAGGKARDLYYLAQGPATGLRFAKSAATEEAARIARKTRAADEAALAKKPASGPLGIRCSILKAGADGRYSESDPHGPFRAGDQVRISLEANDDGFLYVLRGDPAGKWDLLFQGQVARRTRHIVPGSGAIRLEGPSGEIRILATFSRSPLSEPGLVGRDEELTEANRVAAVFRQKSDDRNLLVDKDTAEHAIYAVNPQPESEPRIVLEIPVRWN